jgi:nicotinamide mononucleotide transporter
MDILKILTEPYQAYTHTQILWEIIAASSGIMSVFFIAGRNIWGYPTGILSTLIYSWLLWQWGLMGDMMINIYYTGMSLYGWIAWQSKIQSDDKVFVRYMSNKEYWQSAVIFFVSFIFTLSVYTLRPFIEHAGVNAAQNGGFHQLVWSDFIDAWTTSLFLIAMWLMARRSIEHWTFWITGNIISIPLYIWKGFGITAFQYLVFLILAVYGRNAWKNALNQNQSITSERSGNI